MRLSYITLLFLILLLSCEKDTENEIETTGPFLWAPDISVSLDDHSAMLYMRDPRPYTDYAGPGPATPEIFEVLVSQDQENFEVYRRLKSFENSLEINDLENGRSYYIKVSVHKNGYESGSSNLVMTIPSAKPKIEPYPVGNDLSIEQMTVSSNLEYVTFYNTDKTIARSSQELLVTDNAGNIINSLGYFSGFADWSKGSENLLFMTAKEVGHVIHHDKIVLFNPENEETTEVLNVDFEQYHVGYPTFLSEDTEIMFLSSKDNSESLYFDLWNLNLETGQETRLSNFENMPFYPSPLGYGYSEFDKKVFIGGTTDLENFRDDIFAYDMESETLEPIIQSPWADSRPTLSPDGSKIAFVSSRSGTFQGDIWLYDISTSEYRRITGNDEQPKFYSSNSTLLWLDNDHLLVTLNSSSTKSGAYTIEL